jgi:hypothetical protein
MMETTKKYFCDWPGCGKEVLPYGQIVDMSKDKEPKLMIVIFAEAVKIDGIYCPEHSEKILREGKLINPFLLKSDVDKAIADKKIMM